MGKVEGSSLFHALVISIIIGMLTGSVILAEYYHRTILHRNLIMEEVQRNAESGLNYFCTLPMDDRLDVQDIDLFGRKKDSVSITCKPWGVYDVCTATAHTGDFSATRTAMIGAYPEATDYALWLSDMDRPLRITGTTQLKGKCLLPKAGIERAYIEGKSYSGTALVYGETGVSARFLPKYDEQRMKKLTELLDATDPNEDTVAEWSSIPVDADINRSFTATRFLLESSQAIVMHAQHLAGQIFIRSARSITVEKDCVLENVILAAPKIFVHQSVLGNFQAFASDSILVAEDVQLEYPSALGIVPSAKAAEISFLRVGEKSSIAGELFLVSETAQQARHGSMLLSTDAEIEGEIYCAGELDLKGTVSGSVCCEKFVLHTNSAVYENHLMDAVIDISRRSPYWLGTSLFNKPETSHVMQWLN